MFIEDESTFLQEKPDPSATFPKLPNPKVPLLRKISAPTLQWNRTVLLLCRTPAAPLVSPRVSSCLTTTLLPTFANFRTAKISLTGQALDTYCWLSIHRRDNDVVLALLPFFHIYGMVVIMISTLYQVRLCFFWDTPPGVCSQPSRVFPWLLFRHLSLDNS